MIVLACPAAPLPLGDVEPLGPNVSAGRSNTQLLGPELQATENTAAATRSVGFMGGPLSSLERARAMPAGSVRMCAKGAVLGSRGCTTLCTDRTSVPLKRGPRPSAQVAT